MAAFLKSPSLAVTARRRWWILITATLENLFFSQLLFGWGALLLMLKSEGYYSHLCTDHNSSSSNESLTTDSNGTTPSVFSYTFHNYSSGRHILSAGGALDADDACAAQDGLLNIAYVLSLFSQTGSGFFIGALQDRFGYKKVRLGGGLLFLATHIGLSFITPETSVLLIPCIVGGALSGNVVFLTSLQVANLFGHRRGLIMGVLVGGMTSCAIVFSLFKNLYDIGMPLRIMWIAVSAGGLWIILNTFVTWPEGTIPVPEELEKILQNDKVVKSKVKDQVNAIKDKDEEKNETGKPLMESGTSDVTMPSGGYDNLTFLRALRTGLFLFGTLLGIIFCLRLLLYVGIMYMALLKMTDHKKMNEYVELFGYLQVIAFVACPILNWMLDRGTKPEDVKASSENERQFEIKVRRLENSRLVFIINNVVLLLFGVCVMIPVLEVQILTFITHTVLRGSFMSAVLGSYAVVFPFHILGKIAGLTIFLASLADLVQSPLFLLITKVFNNDPFWVDVGLLVLSFLNFLLPLNLYFLTRRMRRDYAEQKAARDYPLKVISQNGGK